MIKSFREEVVEVVVRNPDQSSPSQSRVCFIITLPVRQHSNLTINEQLTRAILKDTMYKVLLLVDEEVDTTVYNFKDISDGEEFFSYMTNDFHPEWNCNEIVKEFKKVCEAAGITLLSAQLIHKDHIAKQHR